jgi:hypothetical protein
MQMRMAATLPPSARLGGTLGDVFRRALEQVLHHARRAVARARRPAGFPLWPSRNWGILLTPLLVLRFGVRGGGGQKTLCVWGSRRWAPQKPGRFWGAPRPRNEKPGAVSRAGLGHTPEGYLFIHESRFNVQKSQVAEPTSCTGVISCTTHRLYSASQEIFVGHPIVGVRPMKNPARFPARAWTHFSSVALLYLNRVTTPIVQKL